MDELDLLEKTLEQAKAARERLQEGVDAAEKQLDHALDIIYAVQDVLAGVDVGDINDPYGIVAQVQKLVARPRCKHCKHAK